MDLLHMTEYLERAFLSEAALSTSYFVCACVLRRPLALRKRRRTKVDFRGVCVVVCADVGCQCCIATVAKSRGKPKFGLLDLSQQ